MERRISSANASQLASSTSWISPTVVGLEIADRRVAAAEADVEAQDVGLVVVDAAVLHESLHHARRTRG